MDSEVLQRAQALAPLIAGLTANIHQVDPEPPVDDLEWAASRLVGLLLYEGRFLQDLATAAEVERLLDSARHAELRDRRLIRVTLGEVAVSRVGGPDRRGPPQEDQEDLKRVVELLRAPDRRRLWLPRTQAVEAIDEHRNAHPKTPTTETLVERMFDTHVHEGVEGLVLRLERGEDRNWVQPLLPSAAAYLWELLGADFDQAHDDGRFAAWIDRLRRSREWLVQAVGMLRADHRARIVRMAAARVGRDVDTAGFDEERRIRSASPESLPPVPGRASVAAIEMYWDDVHGEAFDETRTLFHLLVLIVLTHDTRQQGCFDQALNLIELGAQKPYLVYTCALHLRFERAPLIAWLLTRPSLVAFAVSLLAELRITEPTMMDEWEKREARKHVRRGVLFREALALAMRTATTSSGGAELMIDVLRGLARRCHRSSLDSAQAISAAKHNEELFALAVSHITEARMERVTVAGRPDYEPLLLADRFEDVVDLLAKDFPDDEVTEQIRVGLELLRFVRERVGAFAHRATGVRDGLERRLTDLLTERYKAALALDAANDAFRHFVASPSLALLPWEHLVAGLQSAGAESLDAWMNTPELTRMLKESDTIATEHERHDVVAGVVARLRSHLAVFLRVYDHLDETPCDDREALKRTFEKEIERLVLARVDAGGA